MLPPPPQQLLSSLPSCHHYHKKIFIKKYFSSQTLKNILHKTNKFQDLGGLTEVNKNNIILIFKKIKLDFDYVMRLICRINYIKTGRLHIDFF
jgi:hypothetical protein